MSKQIIAIWAEARNHVIGKNHTMPWHLPAELAHFKKTTMGSAILMGRVTFDGMNRRCLPGRETLILTRDKDFDCEEVTTVTSVEEALAWFEQQIRISILLVVLVSTRLLMDIMMCSSKQLLRLI